MENGRVTMFIRAFIAAIVAVRMLSAQDDSSALLARATEKILDSIRRLPKYTCLETIDRTYYAARSARLNRRAMTEASSSTCGGYGPLVSMEAADRLRVDVAVDGDTEINSWPGASSFDTRPIYQMIPFGPISTGSFGTFLLDLFANRIAQVTFTERKLDGAQVMFEYSFRVPQNLSRYRVRAGNGWEVTGYSGTFEINSGTAELARLVIQTDRLLPATHLCEARTTIDYHFMLIGDGEFLIPRRSELQTFDRNGARTVSVTGFSACHEYTAESNIRFDDPGTPAESIKTAPAPVFALPAGTSLTLALIRPIDTRIAAGGDAVSAKVVDAVRAPRSKEILVPAGAIAHGRIRQVRQQYSSNQLLISLQ
ncbi:MAG: hypothetical protein ABSB35_11130 [Bryobacteraceae bacterium]